MTTLHLIRHGPTHAKTMIGWTDRPADLSDTDRIARLSAALPDAARMISSDLCRAVETANALARPERDRLPHDPDLREIHFGEWEDRTFAEINAEAPAAIDAFWKTPGPNRAPGGEGWDDLRARVSAAVDRLIPLGGDLIIVAHFGAILTQLQRARGASNTDILGQYIEPLSLTRLRWTGVAWIELCANHQP